MLLSRYSKPEPLPHHENNKTQLCYSLRISCAFACMYLECSSLSGPCPALPCPALPCPALPYPALT